MDLYYVLRFKKRWTSLTDYVDFCSVLHGLQIAEYSAIECLKEKQFDKATELLENAKSELLLAQKTHAELLRTMTNDEAIPMNLLLVHAEDHVASSEVVLTMANELFVVYSILNEGKVY